MRFDLAYFISIVNDWWDVMDSGVPDHRYSRNKSGPGVNLEQQEDSLKRMLGFPEGNNCQHKFGELTSLRSVVWVALCLVLHQRPYLENAIFPSFQILKITHVRGNRDLLVSVICVLQMSCRHWN